LILLFVVFCFLFQFWQLTYENGKGFVISPNYDNPLEWKCKVPGKEGTLWAGGSFPLTLEFPPTYPASPMKGETKQGQQQREKRIVQTMNTFSSSGSLFSFPFSS